MNPKWTTICITCLEPSKEFYNNQWVYSSDQSFLGPKITDKPSNDSPQQYFNFFVEAVFTDNGPSSEDGKTSLRGLNS
jgi:hypothetical protein